MGLFFLTGCATTSTQSGLYPAGKIPALAKEGSSSPMKAVVPPEVYLEIVNNVSSAFAYVYTAGPAETPSIWPVEAPGRYVSNFFKPFAKRGGHKGVDIIVPAGTPIRAAAAGRVTYAGFERGYGLIVKVDHLNGLETWYAHMMSTSAKVGDLINRTDEIGRVGRTGHATAYHLHYEVHKNNQPIDPHPYLPKANQ